MSNRHLLLLVMLATLLPRAPDAATVRVAVNGVDGPQCGIGKALPCRTITRAIGNAAAGDTIEVGPGRYGDVDGDGQFATLGDEQAQVDVGCDCIVHVPVDKRVVIVSRLGAAATLIHAGGAPAEVLDIDAAGTVFGKHKKGFTLTGSGNSRGIDSAAPDLAIAGNVAIRNGSHGMRMSGDRLVITGNQAVANGGSGFQLDGARDVEVSGNVANGNAGDGFEQVNRGTFTGNSAMANGGAGFSQQDDDVVYRASTARRATASGSKRAATTWSSARARSSAIAAPASSSPMTASGSRSGKRTCSATAPTRATPRSRTAALRARAAVRSRSRPSSGAMPADPATTPRIDCVSSCRTSASAMRRSRRRSSR